MEYSGITVSQTDALWELQKAYKAEIEEEIPTKQDLNLERVWCGYDERNWGDDSASYALELCIEAVLNI